MPATSRVLDVIKRYSLLLSGLAVMSFGIAFSIRSDLGTTPISSVPYAVNIITGLSVGTLTIVINLVFLGLQILILRRRFPPVQLLQLPVLLVFGLLNDLTLWILRDVSHSNYLQQWLLALFGIILVGTGVALQVKAAATPAAAEALVLTVSNELNRIFGAHQFLVFGNVKVAFDTTLLVIAVVLGLVFTGTFGGVREGTIAAAVLVGKVAQTVLWVLRPRTGADPS